MDGLWIDLDGLDDKSINLIDRIDKIKDIYYFIGFMFKGKKK